ncbi:hypothetical protein [Streptomyces hyaluromycini]|uniref:hypothetical protein n=1 Tax=Streptomyces hyaluromycini TaxID=1377993 RepID=UPI0011AE6557|nr:hypothetical protein [Streptomyces hyaluromycini]
MDVAVTLDALGHDGPITMFGRSGQLPTVRGPQTSYKLTHLTPTAIENAAKNAPLSIDAVSRMIQDELRAAGSSPQLLLRAMRPQPPLARLSAQLDAFLTSSDIGPQILQIAVATVGQDLWYLLDTTAKHWVLDHLHRTVMALCCPMPAFNATRIAKLLATGQLTVHAGITAVHPARSGGFTVATGTGPTAVDLLVNTITPARRHTPHAARGLIDHAIATGLLHPNPAGGVHVFRHTSQALDVQGRANPHLYILGELTSGAFYFISGMPVLAKRSADIAHHITRHTY